MTTLLVSVAMLVVAGLVVISAISTQLFWLQLIWVLIGAVVVLVFLRIDWRSLFNYEWLIWGFYVFVLILLVFVTLKGPLIRNTRSWIVIGPVTFQPIELMKIALILVYAHYFSRRHLAVARIKNILTSFVYFAIPGALAAIQPDLGSALVLFGIWFGFILVSGLPFKRVVATILILIVLSLFAWAYLFKDYHRERVLGFLYPEENALGINYSVIQSKIAIGSAGLFGKGYGQGSQTQLGFLTEPTNDFVLAALIEEWGVVAGLLIVGLFSYILWKILGVGFTAHHNFEKFICLGTVIVFSMQFLLNAGSTVGILPVVGVTFPFLSYGGSSILTDSILLAIVNAIARRS
jgi:rod shape determining protein RodA